MKIMLDTNVLISAFVFGGKVRETLIKLFETNCEIYVSEYVDDEFKRILYEKWTARAEKIYALYRSMDFVFCSSTSEILGHLRDEKDFVDGRQRFFGFRYKNAADCFPVRVA